jgi:hypothetical protein
MVAAVKWTVKLLQAALGTTAIDADTSLSALIYVILLARPQRLPSTLKYISTYREAKLAGEDAYCFMQVPECQPPPPVGCAWSADRRVQISLAKHFIANTLTRTKRPEEQAAPAAVVERAASLESVLRSPAVCTLLVALLSERDLAISLARVNKQLAALVQLRVQMQRQTQTTGCGSQPGGGSLPWLD